MISTEKKQLHLRFYGYFRSSAAYRCRIAFGLKGVSPEFVPIHLRRGGGEQHEAIYLAINPQALVPTLMIGGACLTQSLAIIEWLEETYPRPPLLPQDSFARAEVRAFALAIATDLHPINNLRVLSYVRDHLGQDGATVETWYRHWCEAGLQALEQLALRSTDPGAFFSGRFPTLADICLIPQMVAARRFGLDTSRFRRLSDIERHCETLSAFAAARPEIQPDAEP